MKLSKFYKSFKFLSAVGLVLLTGTFATGLFAQDSKEQRKAPKIDYEKGPKKVDLGAKARFKLPKGYVFADGDDTRKLMEYMGNQKTNQELGFVSPIKGNWFVVFEFSETGYVKDDDKELDADAIFASFVEGNKSANEWRKQQGHGELNLLGWQIKPHYDSKSNNLEWATLYESGGRKGINYNIRILGRKGVMEATIVCSPEEIKSVLPNIKTMLKNFDYKSGEKYSEFVAGDKVAKYGLAALVTGGAVAAAAKSGLLGKLWKFIAIGAVAILGFFRKIFGGLFGRKEKTF